MNSEAVSIREPYVGEVKCHPWYASGIAVVCCIAAVRPSLLLLTAKRFGFLGDEMYYLDCADHLDWGYVDQPPVAPLLAWFTRHVLGESLFALRLLPALSGAAKVIMAGMMAREFGAKRLGMR